MPSDWNVCAYVILGIICAILGMMRWNWVKPRDWQDVSEDARWDDLRGRG